MLKKEYQIDEDTTVLDSSKKIASRLIQSFRKFVIDNGIAEKLTDFGVKYTTTGREIDNCTVHYLRAAYVYLLSRSFGQEDESFNFKVWLSKMLGHAPGICGRTLVTYDGMAPRGDMLKLLGCDSVDPKKQNNNVPQPIFEHK